MLFLQQLVAKHVLLDQLDAAVQAEQADPSAITPKRFMHNINRICQAITPSLTPSFLFLQHTH